jgi:hypothetical protein
MLTLTTQQHLARVRNRLEHETLSDAEYNDLAVIALHYSIHAKEQIMRTLACVLYDQAVTQRAQQSKESTK